ncbi:MAG: ATP-binding cassette domain-containing protein, partial [Parashewanella sp.]
DREASEEKMLKVLERVKLSEWIEQTANGLKAEIKEGNIGVSVGQAQRIALARLLLRPSSICIADEPTASLDKDSQHAVWHALFEHANNSGFILATHSIEQLMHMDTIWVLENGQLVQQDGYQSLMQTKGAFQTMLESQQESNG